MGKGNTDRGYPVKPENRVYFILFPKPHISKAKCLLWIKLCGRPLSQLSANKIYKDFYIFLLHFKAEQLKVVKNELCVNIIKTYFKQLFQLYFYELIEHRIFVSSKLLNQFQYSCHCTQITWQSAP